MQILADDVRSLLTLDNVEIVPPSKAQIPGELAIRYAAIVMVTLIIAYKLVILC